MKFLKIGIVYFLTVSFVHTAEWKEARTTVKNYVWSVVEKKEKQSGIPLSNNLYIVESLCAYSFPMMFTFKILNKKYIQVDPFCARLIELLMVENQENQYIFFNLSSSSDYTLKVTLSKKRLDYMLQATIEHELGHVYYDHHARHYMPSILSKMLIPSLILSTGAYGLHTGFIPVPEWADNLKYLLSTGMAISALYNCISYVPFVRNSTWKFSTTCEEEADAFISDDINILQGASLLFQLFHLYQIYVLSYTNDTLKQAAQLKKMECAEYAEIYRETSHKYCEKLAHHPHPLPEERRFWCDKRIEKLQEKGVQVPELEPVTVEVYKGDKVVETYTL